MIKIMLMALLLQGNAMGFFDNEDEDRRKELEGFLRNLEQREEIELPITSGHRDDSTGHSEFGAADVGLKHLDPEMQKRVIEEMASSGFRAIDERHVPSNANPDGKGIAHFDLGVKGRDEDAWDEAGTIRREESDKTGKNDYPIQEIIKQKYVNEEKPEVLEARAKEREEKKEEPPMSIEDLLSGKMMSEVPPEDMISNELSEEDQKKLEMERALAKIEEFKRAQAASQDQPVGVDPDSDQNIERQQSQLEAIDKIKAMQAAAPPEEVPQELSALDRLKAAQGERDDRQSEAMRLRGLQKIAQAGAVYADPSFKPDTSGADALMKQANQIPADLLDELKAKGMIQSQDANAQKLQHEELMSNPDSEAAVTGQKIMQDYINKKGWDLELPPLSVKMQKELYDVYMKGGQKSEIQQKILELREKAAKLSEDRLNLLKDKEGRLTKKDKFRVGQKYQDDVRNMVKDMRSTDVWKSASKSMGEIDTIDTLLDDAYEKGGQSLAMLGPKIAKGIAGEVGVLTEQDVTRYVQNPSVVGGLMDTIKKMNEGKITEVSYENLKRLLEIGKKTAQKKIDDAKKAEATLFAKREKIPFEEAYRLIDETSTDKSEAGEIKRKTKDGRVAIFDKNKKFLRFEE